LSWGHYHEKRLEIKIEKTKKTSADSRGHLVRRVFYTQVHLDVKEKKKLRGKIRAVTPALTAITTVQSSFSLGLGLSSQLVGVKNPWVKSRIWATPWSCAKY